MKAWADIPYGELRGRRLHEARAALRAGFPAIARLEPVEKVVSAVDGSARCIYCATPIAHGATACGPHAGLEDQL